MSKVALKGFILVPEKDLELVKHELITHKRLTLEEPGCLTFLGLKARLILFVLMSMRSSSTKPLLNNIRKEFKHHIGEK